MLPADIGTRCAELPPKGTRLNALVREADVADVDGTLRRLGYLVNLVLDREYVALSRLHCAAFSSSRAHTRV